MRKKAFDGFLSKGVVCLVVSSGLDIYPELTFFAEKYKVPVLRTQDTTSDIMGSIISSLNV